MAKNQNSGLTLKHKIGYGAGDCGGVITLVMVSSFMTRYVTNILQVNTTLLATLLLIWNIWDTVNDPLMGTLMDVAFAKAKNKKNKFRPWIGYSIPVLVFGMVAFYCVPGMLGDGFAMVAALFCMKIVYEAGYTMLNIAMGSMLGVMSTNDGERASLSSARGLGSTVGGMLGGMLVPQILAKVGETAQGYLIAAGVCAVLSGILVFIHYAWTEERNAAAQNETSDNETEKIKVSDILLVFKNNRAYLALALHSICITIMQGIYNQASTYMYADVLGDISMMGYTTIVSAVLTIGFLSASPALAKKFGLVKIIRTCLVVGIILFGALFGVMMVSSLPALVYLLWSGIAFAFVQLSVQMQWGLVGESIDYNEYLTGKRTEGSLYGTLNLFRRVGQTIASSLAVLMLGWIGYDGALANAGLPQADSTIFGLKVMSMLIPAIVSIGSWAAFTFVWNINDDVRAKMAAKKAEKAAN